MCLLVECVSPGGEVVMVGRGDEVLGWIGGCVGLGFCWANVGLS